eukprot:18233-Chlamydomonas_euryale.AAC.2
MDEPHWTALPCSACPCPALPCPLRPDCHLWASRGASAIQPMHMGGNAMHGLNQPSASDMHAASGLGHLRACMSSVSGRPRLA